MQLKKYKIKSTVSFLLILLASLTCISQNHNIPWQQKLIFGGNLGLQIGGETKIDVSPEIGYKITEDIIAGVGITYQYYRWKLYNYSTSLYGGKIFSKYYFMENVFGHAEFEMLSLESEVFDPQGINGDVNRFWIQSLFVGGGYKQPIGQNSAFVITVLWNLNETTTSPYSNPIIRFGFVF